MLLSQLARIWKQTFPNFWITVGPSEIENRTFKRWDLVHAGGYLTCKERKSERLEIRTLRRWSAKRMHEHDGSSGMELAGGK